MCIIRLFLMWWMLLIMMKSICFCYLSVLLFLKTLLMLVISHLLASLMVPSSAEKSPAPSVFNLWNALSYDLSTAGWEMSLFNLKSCIVQNQLWTCFLFCSSISFFLNKTNSEMFAYSFKNYIRVNPTQHPDIVLFCWCGCYSGVKPFLLWQPNISAESWIIPAHSSSINSLSPQSGQEARPIFMGLLNISSISVMPFYM